MAALILPAPVVSCHDDVQILRDDLIEGGSKVRVAPALLAGADEWVFAGPAQGYAQLALAIACEAEGKRAVFFTAKRSRPAPLTMAAMHHGCRVVMVPYGRMSNVQAKARAYCEITGARFIELGLLLPGMEDALCALAESLALGPAEVWVAAGSGTLARALARAWPEAEVHAVQVGMRPYLTPGIRLWVAPERFEEPFRGKAPPVPSAINYDAKVWDFVARHARRDGRALWWNVGA